MKTMLRNFFDETKGIAAIEVAFILPFMFLLYFGLYDLTSVISVNRKVTYAASVVVDLVAQNRTSLLKSDIQNYYKASEMVMAPIATGSVRVEVYGYRKTGSTIAQLWKTNNAGSGSCGAAPSTAPMAPLMVSGNDLVVARVCTTYTPFASTFLGHQILGEGTMAVGETIIQRPRSTLQLTCYGTVVGGAVCT